jgi:hypothetical protein
MQFFSSELIPFLNDLQLLHPAHAINLMSTLTYTSTSTPTPTPTPSEPLYVGIGTGSALGQYLAATRPSAQFREVCSADDVMMFAEEWRAGV